MEIILYSLVGALLMMIFFLVGVYVASRLDQIARADAEYQQRKLEAYRLAGVERPGDPLPYVAPVIKPGRRRKIPHMDEIDRRLRAGDRATVKVEE